MEEYLPLFIQVLSGALGGIFAGKLFKSISLGTGGNSIAGILGGIMGGWFLEMMGLGGAVTVLEPSVILGSIAGGGVGGGTLMAIIGALKNSFVK